MDNTTKYYIRCCPSGYRYPAPYDPSRDGTAYTYDSWEEAEKECAWWNDDDDDESVAEEE